MVGATIVHCDVSVLVIVTGLALLPVTVKALVTVVVVAPVNSTIFPEVPIVRL